MNQISKIFFYLLLIGFITLAGCRKAYNTVETVNFKVKLTFPSNYSRQAANKVEVILTNTQNNLKFNALSDANGIASFDDLLPGNYIINGLRSVEIPEAFELIGANSKLFLSADTTNALILKNLEINLKLRGGRVGDLILKEIFYAGSRTPAGGTYFSDQFYEIFNNSLTDTLYLDSLCIGNVGGNPGNTSSQKPYGFQSDRDNTYLVNVWRIPANPSSGRPVGKTLPIPPGKSVIIAQDGINHKTDPLGNVNSLDLGKGVADYESYVPRADNRDLDAPDVPNLDAIYLGSVGFDWLTAVFGASIVIFKDNDPASLPRFKEPGSTAATLYVQVPNGKVLDAVDIAANANAISFKRIPSELDAGFTFCSNTYTGESVRRKILTTINGRVVLQDTNNSSIDLDLIIPPTPKNW